MLTCRSILICLAASIGLRAHAQQPLTVWLSDLDLSAIRQSWSHAHANTAISGGPLRINHITYTNGIGTHANSEWSIDLKQKAVRLTGAVGLDDLGKDPRGKIFPAIRFIAIGDGKILWQSPIMITGRNARQVDIDLNGVRHLSLLVVMATDVIHHDHGNWVNVKLQMHDTTKPESLHELPAENAPVVTALFQATALKSRPPVAKQKP